ncbi:MAG: ABC transporter substrate-binding protein, partial [Thermoplasmatota archaeon]
MDRKVQIFGVVIAVVLIVVLTYAYPFNGGSDSDIRYGGQYYPGEFLLKGNPELWETYDLEVEHTLFSSGAENNKALISGDVDVNCGADSKTIALFNSIPDKAVIIGTVQRGDRYATVVREGSDYDSWEDLKGKTVATRFGTGAEGILRRYFEEEGYDWEDDFDFVNMKIEDMINALDSGQIEAFTAWEPTPAIAEAQGVAEVMTTYSDTALVPASIHTTQEFAENNEDELIRFLAAQLDKAEMIKNNTEEA